MLYAAMFDLTTVAVFFDEEAARTFIRQENDVVQCDMLNLEEVPLIDTYGFPMRAKDFPAVYGRLIGQE